MPRIRAKILRTLAFLCVAHFSKSLLITSDEDCGCERVRWQNSTQIVEVIAHYFHAWRYSKEVGYVC